MPTVAVLNSKGGAGKTTVATCLARALEAYGDSVLLVDSDPQGSTRDWHAIDDANPTAVVGLDKAGSLRSLKSLGTYDWTIIDGAGRYERIIAEAVGIADLVLVPTQPSPYDVWALNDVVSLVQQRQAIADGQPVLGAIITRAVPRTVLDREILDALREQGLEVMDSRLYQRQIYPRSANEGRTPLEAEPKGAAADEIRAAAAELRAIFS
jgi:chromosome partitioning protein